MMRVWMAILAALLLAACGSEEHSDIKQWMKDSTKDLHGHVKPLPEVKPFPVVSYDAMDVVDPFRPSKIEPESKRNGGGGLKPDFDRPKTATEYYPLGSMKFVGVVREGKSLQVMLSVDNKIFRLKIGDRLGQNFGVITDIQAPFKNILDPDYKPSRFVVREVVQDATGDWVEQISTVELSPEEAKK
jgi:type IV pilus assembly protein PilP